MLLEGFYWLKIFSWLHTTRISSSLSAKGMERDIRIIVLLGSLCFGFPLEISSNSPRQHSDELILQYASVHVFKDSQTTALLSRQEGKISPD